MNDETNLGTNEMRLIGGFFAVILTLLGIIMVWQSFKNGKVFDYMEGSDTEQQWIFRDEDPGKFLLIIAFYFLIFSAFIAMFIWIANGGVPDVG